MEDLNKSINEKLKDLERITKLQKDIEDKFPNGFESWHQTHFEMAQGIIFEILNQPESDNAVWKKEESGHGRLYKLAKEWTNEFELLYKGRQRDGEFDDLIEEFLKEKLK